MSRRYFDHDAVSRYGKRIRLSMPRLQVERLIEWLESAKASEEAKAENDQTASAWGIADEFLLLDLARQCGIDLLTDWARFQPNEGSD